MKNSRHGVIKSKRTELQTEKIVTEYGVKLKYIFRGEGKIQFMEDDFKVEVTKPSAQSSS